MNAKMIGTVVAGALLLAGVAFLAGRASGRAEVRRAITIPHNVKSCIACHGQADY